MSLGSKTVSIIAAAALAASACVALSGCETVSQVVGQGKIGEAVTTSRHVDAKDRENYVQLQDVNGNIFVSVIYAQEAGTTKLNADKLKEELSKLDANWYQFIGSNSMGTNTQERAYIYFPSDMSLTKIIDISNKMNADGYESHVLTQAEYDDYAKNVSAYDIYHNETTYFGPAAGK